MRKPLPFAAGILAMVLFAGAAGVAIGASSRSGPSVSNLALLNGVIELVQRDYVHPVGPDELTKDALKGMLSRLDPHSDYMDESEFKESQNDLSGRFGGLGIQISAQDGVPKVISPIDDTPASRAGLAGGDLIVAIDGRSTHGVDLQKIVRILRGNPGTPVKLTISRGAQPPFEVAITRAIIAVPSIKSQMQPNNIGYVRITEFGSETARDFRKAIDTLKNDAGGKLRGLVLDLRNDPGGLLNAAVEISGNFLDGGTVVSIRGRQKTEDRTFTAPAKGDLLPGVPVAVLRQGIGAVGHPARGPRRAAAHHRAVLHAGRPLDPGRRHHARHPDRGAQGAAGRRRADAERERAQWRVQEPRSARRRSGGQPKGELDSRDALAADQGRADRNAAGRPAQGGARSPRPQHRLRGRNDERRRKGGLQVAGFKRPLPARRAALPRA
jgi:C-terminal peptidase prc